MNLTDLIANGIAVVESTRNGGVSNTLHNFMRSQGIDTSNLWKPTVDMSENNNEINLYVSLPGVKKEDVDVDFYNNKVTIKGKRAQPYADSECKHAENSYGHFERIITLPISVTSPGSVKLTTVDGVLNIKIDKKNEERNRFSMNFNESE